MPLKSFFKLMAISIIIASCADRETQSTESIIPQPQQIQYAEGAYSIGKTVIIQGGNIFPITSSFLENWLTAAGVSVSTANSSGDIFFKKDTNIDSEEGYQMTINETGITISAATDQGAFYAVQSLRQLLPPDYESGQSSKVSIRHQTIKDAPRFRYRGMHLDVGRHFFPPNFIKKYIDALAMLKMNTFHWHLTEDQGWRIEIKQYPKLQEVAAYRAQTLIGHYGDQPHTFDGKRYGGYYTQDEVCEIVQYAADRHVTVIPEIELPGHSQAALTAYPELGCTGGPYKVAEKWGVFDDIYCTKEETFEFLENVLDEVIALFPSEYIHIGGDEAPKTRWKECPHCQKRIKEEGLKDEHELQNYFITRMEKYLNSKGRQIIGWDEILEGGLAPNATVMSWRGTNGAVQAAKMGHDVILTPTSTCYFDYYQSENKDEPLAIGGFLPLEKVYEYDPIPQELNAEQAKYVLGVQGNIWTEYMPTSEQVEYMAFPRILAMSEIGWTDLANKDFTDFTERVAIMHDRLDVRDINYANHLYEVEGRVDTIVNGVIGFELYNNGRLGTIKYTMDGSAPTAQSDDYTTPIKVSGDVLIRAQTFDSGQPVSEVFSQPLNTHKGVGKEVSINVQPHKSYDTGGIKALVNGIAANTQRFRDKEWLGFWGDDLEITIDLGAEQSISNVSTRFYDDNGSWIYPPPVVMYSFDDESNSIEVPTIEDDEQKRMSNNALQLDGKTARYVHIRIPSYGTIPEGLEGAGYKGWTFLDEIIIE